MLEPFQLKIGAQIDQCIAKFIYQMKSQLWSTVHDLMDLEVEMSWIRFIHVETSVI